MKSDNPGGVHYALQEPEFLSQAAALQNVWYPVADLENRGVVTQLGASMQTLAEDIEMRVTVDGGVPKIGAQAAAAAGTPYYFFELVNDATGATFLFPSTSVFNMGSALVMGMGFNESFLLEIRKISNNGANALTGWFIWQKVVKI